MPRPKKCRRIGFIPKYREYGPRDRNHTSEETILLQLDEIEAIRLKDIEKLDQSEGAKLMGVSRQTFQNIIESAREKIARSLLEGVEIRIEGGHVINKHCIAVCEDCGKSYNMEDGEWTGACASCGSTHLYCSKKDRRCCL
ncbi:MAG: DUF134 domain-containing protein [Vallitaleaceae bacterium]|jgi:predicted DNA-binding protein (UPF0251 family)|nr:DUF134 domain-containing protein [Vallitaleaceae bacterium]